MKKKIFFATVFLTVFLCFSWAEDTGSLAIVCDPGFSVQIDGAYYGETTGLEQGKIIDEIAAGNHSLRIEQEGFQAESIRFVIQKGKTTVLRISPKKSSFTVKKLGESAVSMERETGNLVARSLPVGADFFIDGTKIGNTDLEINDFLAGSHSIRFELNGRVLEGEISLEKEDTLNILANLIKNEISVESKLEEDARIAAEKKEAELAKQRAEERRKRQEEQRIALQEMAKNSKFRVIIDSYPPYSDFYSYVTRTRKAYASISSTRTNAPESERSSEKQIGGISHINYVGSHFTRDSANQAILKDKGKYEQWISTAKFNEYEKIHRDMPYQTNFLRMIEINQMRDSLSISYTDVYTLQWLFKKYSDRYHRFIDMEYRDTEITLQPGLNDLHVDMKLEGGKLVVELNSIVHINTVENTRQVVRY